MGEVDTLNSQLGLLLAELADAQVQWPALDELISVFGPCQHRLFDLGGELAMPDYQALQESEIERRSRPSTVGIRSWARSRSSSCRAVLGSSPSPTCAAA